MPVDTVTLDSFFEQLAWPQVDFIKMDIEGAEPLALQGMKELIRRRANLKLVVELNASCLSQAGHDPRDFVSQLQELGFRLYVFRNPGGWIELNVGLLEQLLGQLREFEYVSLFCEKG